MRSSIVLFSLLLNIVTIAGASGTFTDKYASVRIDAMQQELSQDNQILFNGRIWKNLYYMVEGDQFLFAKEFLPGSVTMKGKLFTNVSIKYDIFKDEILTPIDPFGGILQLNKEMVDSFTVFYQNRTYQFIKIPEDSLLGLNGYANILYNGKTSLYVKYNKKIDRPSVKGENDKFYQVRRIYFMKNNKAYLITNKRDLLKIMIEDKEMVKHFIKTNRIKVSKNNPESFLPLIGYYDSISQ